VRDGAIDRRLFGQAPSAGAAVLIHVDKGRQRRA
jgi:hypothetical protein